MMDVKSFVNSLYSSVSYLINKRILIDAGDWKEEYRDVDKILLTHAHFDHIYGLNDVLRLNPKVKVYTNEVGREMLLNAKKNLSYYHETPFEFESADNIYIVRDGDEIPLSNNLVAKAIFTPGHNPSCITWVIGDCIFSGDSLIPGIKTVTNLPKGNKAEAEKSEILIRELAKGRKLFPGHQIQ